MAFSVSCKTQSEQIPDKEASKEVEIINDSLIQGRTITLKIDTRQFPYVNVDEFFADFLYYVNNDNRFKVYNNRVASSRDNRYIYITDTIPADAGSVAVDVCGKYDRFALFRTSNLPIYTQKGEFAAGALNTIIYFIADKSNYLEYVRRQRSLYPADFNVWAAKWMFEMEEKVTSIASLNNDMQEILKSQYTPEQKSILSFIGKSYADKKIDSTGLNFILNLKNSTNLNYEILDMHIEEILKHFLSDEDNKKATFTICSNNPNSKFTWIKLISGEIIIQAPKDVLVKTLTSVYKDDSTSALWMTRYADMIVSKKDPKEAMRILEILCERMEKGDPRYFYTAYNNCAVNYAGEVVEAIYNCGIALREYEKSIKMIKIYEPYYRNANEFSLAYYYTSLAKTYTYVNTDSAAKYYAASLRLKPQDKKVRADFSGFLVEKKITSEPEKYIDSIVNSLKSTDKPIPDELPALVLNDDAKINLTSYKGICIIIRTSETCSPCRSELKYLLSGCNFSKPIKILLSNNDHFKLLKSSKFFGSNKNFYGIKNGRVAEKILNMTGEPTTIIVKDGKIIYQTDGFGEPAKREIECILQLN